MFFRKENRLKLEEEAYEKMYSNNYNELDLGLFEAKDPKGYIEFQKLNTEVLEARKASVKKKWPY